MAKRASILLINVEETEFDQLRHVVESVLGIAMAPNGYAEHVLFHGGLGLTEVTIELPLPQRAIDGVLVTSLGAAVRPSIQVVLLSGEPHAERWELAARCTDALLREFSGDALVLEEDAIKVVRHRGQVFVASDPRRERWISVPHVVVPTIY